MQDQQRLVKTEEAGRARESEAARLRQTLALAHPPVAMAFLDAPPDGVPTFQEAVSAACALWPRAAAETFYASAAAHMGCAVGARTLGFPLGEQAQTSLADVIEVMGAVGYLHPDEIGGLPAISNDPAGVLYGPLASFPADPDLILIWIDARQAMICGEATQAARWNVAGSLVITGRPGCAALPVAKGTAGPVVSLGCTGMRMRAGVDDAHMLAALSGRQLPALLAALENAAAANHAMDGYYRTGGVTGDHVQRDAEAARS